MGDIAAQVLDTIEHIVLAGESFRDSHSQGDFLSGDDGSATALNNLSAPIVSIDALFRLITGLAKKLARVERGLNDNCQQTVSGKPMPLKSGLHAEQKQLSGYLSLKSLEMAKYAWVAAVLAVVSCFHSVHIIDHQPVGHDTGTDQID